jgi:hypothetical protein
MRAREDIRYVLIAKKMRRWALLAKYPLINPRFPAAKARKNFWRLLDRYPQIAAELGLTRASVFDPY